MKGCELEGFATGHDREGFAGSEMLEHRLLDCQLIVPHLQGESVGNVSEVCLTLLTWRRVRQRQGRLRCSIEL